ncbi:reverse transcriptase [Trichonephila clavipes]|nr:reverse transcriptase [Trichonephila clavipes]
MLSRWRGLGCLCSYTQLLAAGQVPAKVDFFIDSQAAILALSSSTPADCLNTINPISRHPEIAEAVARFHLITGHDFLGVYLYWHGLAADEACPSCGHARMDSNHLLQCTGLDEYLIDGIVNRYWEARRQLVKKPSTDVGEMNKI